MILGAAIGAAATLAVIAVLGGVFYVGFRLGDSHYGRLQPPRIPT